MTGVKDSLNQKTFDPLQRKVPTLLVVGFHLSQNHILLPHASLHHWNHPHFRSLFIVRIFLHDCTRLYMNICVITLYQHLLGLMTDHPSGFLPLISIYSLAVY